MSRAAAALLLGVLASGCASRPRVEEWGLECRAEREPGRRLDLVRRMMESGDERAIPALADCLEAARLQGKLPDRVYGSGVIEPNVTVPAELWGLIILTGQDFDLDFARWRAWYAERRGRLQWDGGRRRFSVP